MLDFYNDNDATDKFTIENIKIERGTVATDWTPAPEDAQNDIKPLVARVTSTESDIKVLKDGLQLSATKKDVEETLNDQLQPIKNQVEQNSATLNVLPNEINSKVSKEDYTTDQNKLVTRLNNADSERKQLSNSISDKVSLTEYNSGISGAKSYTDNKVDNMNIGARNLFVQDFSLYNTGNLYAYRKISDTNTPKVITITDNDTTVDMTGIFFGLTGNGANADGGVRWEMFKGNLLRNSDKDSSLISYNYFHSSCG